MARKSISDSDLSTICIQTPISQSESKRIVKLLPVLDYILKNPLFSAKQIEKSVPKVSRDSIDKTLKKLKDQKYIEFKEIKSRGEKFYQIKSKSEIKSYRTILFRWHVSKIMLDNQVQRGATRIKK